ncbi:MAG: tRNA uridine-5-carboxymethylaminomethyl(34) synthesis GTPase MnmE [Alphaproteobacteria bacterium]
MLRDSDTIFALSSGAGKAGIAVVRISGSQAGTALKALTGRPLPEPRHAVLVPLRESDSRELIDRALVLWFPAPRSETGEDTAEFHVHGGRAVLTALYGALGGMSRIRLAEPGEFARRAFRNGKLDLTALEGLADLIDAETAAQRRVALRQMDGVLAALYESWRTRLLRASALIEAHIDFSDDGVTDAVIGESLAEIASLAEELRSHLAAGARGQTIRDGIEVAILGAPNVGKSSLINALARRDAAIVTPIAGTTRDVIEVRLDLEGWPLLLADTAGLRETENPVEIEGIRRARARADSAALKLIVFDATASTPDALSLALLDGDSLAVLNKADLTPSVSMNIRGVKALKVSALQGTGLDALRDWLVGRAAARFGQGDSPVFTRERHRQALQSCLDALQLCMPGRPPELLAENCRHAAFSLGRITGSIGVEDLLDLIFKDFCIGK